MARRIRPGAAGGRPRGVVGARSMTLSRNLTEGSTLPALINEAITRLASATTAAEVLEARDAARFAYTTAKAAGRLAKAKEAHDEVIVAVYRAQADAMEIEAAAQRRFAEEYAAAQERGDAAVKGRPINISDENIKPTAPNLGVSAQEVFQGRQIGEAETIDPGIVRRTLDEAIAEGREPTKAEVRDAITRTVRGSPVVARSSNPAVGAATNLRGRLEDIIRLFDTYDAALIASGIHTIFGPAYLLEPIPVVIGHLNEIMEILALADALAVDRPPSR